MSLHLQQICSKRSPLGCRANPGRRRLWRLWRPEWSDRWSSCCGSRPGGRHGYPAGLFFERPLAHTRGGLGISASMIGISSIQQAGRFRARTRRGVYPIPIGQFVDRYHRNWHARKRTGHGRTRKPAHHQALRPHRRRDHARRGRTDYNLKIRRMVGKPLLRSGTRSSLSMGQESSARSP
jgi:hypothetical protein